jgi:hypothetical protein
MPTFVLHHLIIFVVQVMYHTEFIFPLFCIVPSNQGVQYPTCHKPALESAIIAYSQ